MKKTAIISLSLMLAACASSDIETEVRSESYLEKFESEDVTTSVQTAQEATLPSAIIEETVISEVEIKEKDATAESVLVETTVVETVVVETHASGVETTPSKGFSIQLATLSDMDKATQFADTVNTSYELWIQQKEVKGSVVYSVLMGDFGDYDETKAVIATLPEPIKKLNPFLKNFSDKELAATDRFKKIK